MKGFLFLTDDGGVYSSAAKVQELALLRCKHVMDVSSQKAKRLLDASVDLGYEQVLWGYGEGLYTQPEDNRIVQINRVQRFIYDGVIRPMRIVVDSKGRWWPDNLHTAIAHVLCQGTGCKVADTPFYIIDLSAKKDMPTVYDPYRLLDLNKVDGAIESALERDSRTGGQVCSVYYNIQEFMRDNNICWSQLTLDSMYKNGYARSVAKYLDERRCGNG